MIERAHATAVKLDGIYVQKMHRGGTELLVSAFRHPIFGPVVSVGSGGALTELIKDLVIERATRTARFRPAHRPTFIARFSELAAAAPWSRIVLEVNPIKWQRGAAVAVDGLLIVEQA